MAPLGRRRVHFEAAADGLHFLAAIFKDHDDIGQVLPHLLLEVFIRGWSFVWIPVAELREANETVLSRCAPQPFRSLSGPEVRRRGGEVGAQINGRKLDDV